MSREIPLDAPSIITGGYVGVIAAAVGTRVGLGRTPLFVGCLLAAAIVALAAGGRPSLWVAMGRRRLLTLPMAVPLASCLVLVVGLEYGLVSEAYRTPLPWSFALALVGIGVWQTGTTAYAERAAGDRRASWTASADATRRRRKTVVVTLGAVGCVGAFFVVVWYGAPSFFLSGIVAFTVATWITGDRQRTYDACEHGLRFTETGAVGYQFTPWDRFDGRRETDDAIVLERRWWIDERMTKADVPPAAREALAASIGA
ncbi:hypothetical protein [Halosolutus gelatinilyticus]|uniref:hypothetical protein n=1 Tax=Halosolutus gelatinilyticus TaxID=2931975 RepID=UPI001FF35354|nr:hypothetical protein [Halosolutus gelatinilyticus]